MWWTRYAGSTSNAIAPVTSSPATPWWGESWECDTASANASLWAKRATAGQTVAPHPGHADGCGARWPGLAYRVSERVCILSAGEWTCLTQT
jgi:hypothetical protein